MLFGNIYVALGAVCLIQSSIIQLGCSARLLYYSLLVFFSTLFVYNFQRFFYKPTSDDSLNSIRRKWIFKNRISTKTLTLIGLTGVVIAFFLNDRTLVFLLSPMLVLSLIYFLPFIKLRKSPLLKLLTLGIVWTMATAVVPIVLIGIEPISSGNLLHILIRFCFIIAICIPFDIRDQEIDKADSVSTLPLILSENKARWIAFGFMLVYITMIVFEYIFAIIILKVFIALMLSALINALLVLMSNSKRSEYFYVAGIDGTMILQGLLLMGTLYL